MEETDSVEVSSKDSSARPAWGRRLVLGAGIAFAIYVLVGFLVVPYVVKDRLISTVEEQIGLAPTVERVRFNPLSLRLTVDGFDLSEPDASQPLLAFASFVADLAGPGLLFRRVGFDEISLAQPVVSAAIEESGELNFMRLWATAQTKAVADVGPDPDEAEPASSGEVDADQKDGLFLLDAHSIRVEGGTLSFSDRSKSQPFSITVSPIDFQLDSFSTRTGATSPTMLTLRVGDQTELRWKGSIGIAPIRSTGHVELEGFDLRVPWEYARDAVAFEVREGRLGLAGDYTLSFEQGLALEISDASVRVDGLSVLDAAEDVEILGLPSLAAEGVEASVGGSGLERLSVQAVTGREGRLATRLDSDGRLRLVDVFTPAAAAPSEDAVETAEGDSDLTNSGDGPPEIRVARVALDRFEIDFEDRSAPRPVPLRIKPLDVVVTDYGNTQGSEAHVHVSAHLQGREGEDDGQLEIDGPLRLEPLEATLSVVARHLALEPFEGYADETARLIVSSGSLSGDLAVNFAAAGPKGGASSFGVKGRLSVDDLITRDRLLQREFVRWKAVRLEGIDLGADRLRLQELALEGVLAAVVLGPEGQSNLDAIFADSAASEAKAGETRAASATTRSDGSQPSTRPFALQIDRVTISDSGVRYADLSLKPDLSISLANLSGSIEGLSSDPASRARIALEARIDGKGPLTVSGQMNALSAAPYADIAVEAGGISMPNFSAYSSRYVGYVIDRGNLDLDLEYKLDGKTLDARNHLVLDRFEFGESVEGSPVYSLPLPLAAVVMRDSSGRIDLDLPVHGNLDDPSFSVLSVIGQTFVKVIMKAATTPFALIPMPGGGGGDPSHIGFTPGSDDLSLENADLLAAVVGVLAQKPDLNVEIVGRADRAVDGAALASARVDASVRQIVFDALPRRERNRFESPERLEIDPAQRLAALEKLYAEGKGGVASAENSSPDVASESSAQAATAQGRTRRIEDLTRALVGRLEVDEKDLRAIARTRAGRIQAQLLSDGTLDEDRVFLRGVEIGAFESEDGVVSAELLLSTR